MSYSKVVIIDYGSQLTQLIARRVREAGVYSEIQSCEKSVEEIAALNANAIILSGGPASVSAKDAPKLDAALLELGLPILGICYGMELLAHYLGGTLASSNTREYGPAELRMTENSLLWKDLDREAPTRVWMSHGDRVTALPKNFQAIGRTEDLDIAAMADPKRKIYAVQFHPEVHHSVDGARILANFLFEIAGLTPDWTMHSFVEHETAALAKKIGNKHVICALSGGIDSTVVACLLHKAIGNQLHCICGQWTVAPE